MLDTNPRFHGRSQRKIRVGQFSQRPQAAGREWGRAPRSAASENFLGSRWGQNSQNLRSREGFCKKLKGWRGVWGAALAKFLILMLFYVFLHHFLSIFLIFNNFLSFFSYVFLSFLSVLGLYSHARVGQLPPLPPQGGAVTCQGGAAAPSAPPWLRPCKDE